MGVNRTSPDQYQLRFPPGLRDRIKTAADEAGRSMNAEIIRRLEDSFGALPSRDELDSFVADDLGDKDWATPILDELRKPQPDLRRVVEFLDFLGVDAVSEIRRRREGNDRTGDGP